MSVLIVTLPGDVHSHAVRWAIEQMGGSARLFYPADLCNGGKWAFDPLISRLSVEYDTRRDDVAFDEYRTVWMRRPPVVLAQERIADKEERAISEDDFGTLARSMYLLMERGRFVVSPHENIRSSGLKPYQFGVAREVGLRLPRTLIGNDPRAVLEFYNACDGNIVFKAFKSPIWQTERGPRMVPTTRVSREMLESCDLSVAPGIFQEDVRKCAEIRATIMGRSVFAWEKRFDGREDLDVDWRFMFKNAKHSICRLPPEIEAMCFDLLDRLGLVFGCFDFVVDAEGRYFFLEVNPQGQWLAGDAINEGLNQLEAMAEFLLSEDPHFKSSRQGRIRWSDYPKGLLEQTMRREEKDHHGHLMTFMYHQASFRMETATGPGPGCEMGLG